MCPRLIRPVRQTATESTGSRWKVRIPAPSLAGLPHRQTTPDLGWSSRVRHEPPTLGPLGVRAPCAVARSAPGGEHRGRERGGEEAPHRAKLHRPPGRSALDGSAVAPTPQRARRRPRCPLRDLGLVRCALLTLSLSGAVLAAAAGVVRSRSRPQPAVGSVAAPRLVSAPDDRSSWMRLSISATLSFKTRFSSGTTSAQPWSAAAMS